MKPTTDINTAAAALGRKGGAAKTQAKAAAAAANGRKGGRPRLTLEQKLERVFETGLARLTIGPGHKVRVTYYDDGDKGTLRAHWVRSGQATTTFICEESTSAAMAAELRRVCV